MLTREELREIAAMEGDSAYFVSLYLNVDPVESPGGGYLIWLKNELRAVAEALPPGVVMKVRKDLVDIEAFVQDHRREFRKGVAVISSSEMSFWRDYNLSVPLRSEMIVQRSPYVKPLLDVLDRYRRYAVLLVDKGSARIFVMHLGEIVEYGEVHTPGVPGKHKKGGWYALAQTHYDRHIDYHVGLHLKDVLSRLDSFIKRQEVDMLVLGGPGEAVARAREMLPKATAGKVIGTFSAGMFESNADILKRAWPVVLEHERLYEEETVRELIEKARKGEKAVTGLEAVLGALEQGRILRLVFERDLKERGFRCEGCGALYRKPLGRCRYCGGRVVGVKYIIDFAAQKTVEQGAGVEVVSPGGELRGSGGIGAFLRF